MSSKNMIIRDIKNDITLIDEVTKSGDLNRMHDVHLDMDGKYQSLIKNWGLGQFYWTESHGFYYDSLEAPDLIHNLKNMKGKIEGYIRKLQMDSFTISQTGGSNNEPHDNSINIYNNQNNINSLNLDFDFSIIEKKILDCESLTEEETRDAQRKLIQLKKIYNSSETRKAKWKKIKEILKWLAEKGVDLAIEFLPIIVSTLKK